MQKSTFHCKLLTTLLLCAMASCAVLDWTEENATLLWSNTCITQLKDLKKVWTGDCEGSYASMVSSVIQDNICIAFDKRTVTDANLRKLINIKVSYTDLICTCEICQQHPGKGCSGGSLKDTLEYIRNEGFLGGGDKDNTAGIEITGTDIWKTTFNWNYFNCLGFFKNYCELGSTTGTS